MNNEEELDEMEEPKLTFSDYLWGWAILIMSLAVLIAIALLAIRICFPEWLGLEA